MLRLTLTMTAVAALAACSEGSPQARYFDQEAGSTVDIGEFGNATMNNTLAQTGQQDFTVSLNRRFSAEVPTTINFAFNSTDLDESARATLRLQADWIKQFPEVRFKVFGHTDLVGSNAYNRGLGLRRAQTTVAYLVSLGIERSRLDAVVTYGETQPLIATEGMERANRRTVTEVTGFVQEHPGVLNGKYAEVIFREYVKSATPRPQIEGNVGSDVATSN